MFLLTMENKGYSQNQTSLDTSNKIELDRKALNGKNNSNRVDINVLKSKLKASKVKEFKKNAFIISFLILILGILGVYFSF